MEPSKQLRLVFLADYPFSDRDFERFGIATLRRFSDVVIFDVANIVDPKSLAIRALPRTTDPRLMTFATIEDVVDELLDYRPHAVVSNIGLSKTRQTIYETLKSIGTEIYDLRLCLTPGDSITTDPSWVRIINRVKQTTGFIGLLKLIGRKYFSPQIDHIQRHDFQARDLVTTGDELEQISKNLHSLALQLEDRARALERSRQEEALAVQELVEAMLAAE